MTNGIDIGTLDGDDALAAEYVLGVLDDAQRRDCADRVAQDPAFANLVAAWQARFADLDADFAEVAPPTAAKTAIDRRLFGAPAAKSGFWASLGAWRGLAAVAATAAIVLAIVVTLTPGDPQPGDRLLAALAPNDSELRFVALYDTATRELSVTRVAGDPPAGRDLELWLIAGDDPPASLGVIGADAGPAVVADLQSALVAGTTLAVSVEPVGGSTTGAPTGPVVALGTVQEI